MIKCDVIIPIYNAYDCLESCIESVLHNTDMNNNRLILIDDCSPDERVIPLLEKYSKQKGVVLLKNDKNLGFVGTVNKGMKYSNSDVVLLNSDTEVPNRWLDNLKEYAYKENMIATVTPFSNNATLVSVPVGLQRNEIPENISLDMYADIVEKSSYSDIIELPTSHGFCVYIRRDALDVVGYFDEETFGKGYGEENDFSFRCIEYGYRNILCPSTIVYHKESQSFSTKKEKLAEEHGLILQEKYPVSTKRLSYWLSAFPIKKHCINIDYQLLLNNRKNILITIHDFDVNHLGGTTMHVMDLIENNRKDINFHVLAPSNGKYILYSFFENEERTLDVGSITITSDFELYNAQYKEIITNVISGFRIEFVHIHHMIGHFFDIVDVAKEYNVKTAFTFHDFYSICPTINLLFNKEKCCVGKNCFDCSKCLKDRCNINNDITQNWRSRWHEFLKNIDFLIAPSNNTKEIVNLYYKDLLIDVIEHGIDVDTISYIPNPDKVLNVAFVGVCSKHKGSEIFKELITKNNNNIKFHLFGLAEDDFFKKSRKNYVYHGTYLREDLKSLLINNSIDVVCFLAIWPETYSYTLTEVISTGIPSISYDIGAIADRIKKYNLGWTVDKIDSKSMINKLENIYLDKDTYNNVLDSIQKYKIKSVKTMADEYLKMYNKTELITLTRENADALKKLLNKEDKGFVYIDPEIDLILNSLRWKLVSKIKCPQFISKPIKKILRKR